ncbi:MAG: tetratricopeptide repeat protein [Chitinispirillaceae bacterium]
MTDEIEMEKLRMQFREHPRDLDCGLSLIQRCADLGWYNEGLDVCRNLLKFHEKEYSLLLEYGNILYKHNDMEEAKEVFSKLVKIKPDRIEAWNNLGILQLAAGEFENAARSFEQILQMEPENPGALLNLGNYYSEKGDLFKAHSCFEQATSGKPDFPEAWYNLGNSYLVLSEYEKAKRAFKKALHYDPLFGSAYKNLGFTCEKMEDCESALEYYQKAFEFNKADAGIQINMAGIYLREGELDEAFRCCRNAVRLAPREPCGWSSMRKVALKLKDGASYLRATLALISRLSDTEVAYSIGDLREMGREQEAQKLLEHADRLSRGGDLLDALRLVLYRKRKLQPGRTAAIFRRLSLIPDPDMLILECLAEYAYMIGSYERVIMWLEPIENLPIKSKILLWRSYMKTGSAESAEKLACEYTESVGEEFDCLLLLAELHAAEGDEENAREYLVRACRSGKGDFLSLQVNPLLLKIYRNIEKRDAAAKVN